jgi:hypothetical protein
MTSVLFERLLITDTRAAMSFCYLVPVLGLATFIATVPLATIGGVGSIVGSFSLLSTEAPAYQPG